MVTIGGGTGLSVLRDLNLYQQPTAVVTVTDDGGSSGRLRGELGILPPGDIRSCLLALADTEPVMEKLFDHALPPAPVWRTQLGNFDRSHGGVFGFQEAVRLW